MAEAADAAAQPGALPTQSSWEMATVALGPCAAEQPAAPGPVPVRVPGRGAEPSVKRDPGTSCAAPAFYREPLDEAASPGVPEQQGAADRRPLADCHS